MSHRNDTARARSHADGKPVPSPGDFSIVAIDKFIHATRDSGYKGTSSAIAELVDNAIQADARRIRITVASSPDADPDAIDVLVRDDGTGMDPFTLRHALRFGGSTRFNDRTGLGRYGMGLPNSSLSQARRVTVYTWRSPRNVFMSYLDVDEISSGEMTEVPSPRRVDSPTNTSGKSGTIVVWSRCDRLDFRRVTTISRKLLADLGRRFRHFITDGVTISVNGDRVEPLDPLYLNPLAKFKGATLFGQPVDYEVRAESDNGDKVIGNVRVTFSELPVHEWHKFSNDEKRRLGISKGAGVSIVRAGREVDYGWFFLGSKARENYDDWWRCEIQFPPILDEAFGITHTKQQVRPKAYLIETLSPDIEAAARALNARARKAHLAAKAAERFSESEKLAAAREKLLQPLPAGSRRRDQAVLDDLKKRDPAFCKPVSANGDGAAHVTYKIVETAVRDTAFFNYARQDGRLILVLNPHHPFYKVIYKQLTESDEPRDLQLRTQLELLLLAAARSEAAEDSPRAVVQLERQRQLWSDTLATFLNG
jgi:hypothetical protein